MRTGVTISTIGHTAALLWGVLAFVATPYKTDAPEAMPIDVISATEFSQLTAGHRNAPKAENSKPMAEKVGERKLADDPTAKVVDTKEIKAATEAPPPMPEPKPPIPVEKKPPPPEKKSAPVAEKKPPEPKHDLIAEALKKEEAKKPEPKKEAKPTPTPPAKPVQQAQPAPPKFDPRKVEALLDKRAPQRLASVSDEANPTVSLGTSSGLAARLSQSELDALRARLAQLWSPPAGAKNPEELVVQIRMQLKPDGTLAGPPMVLTSGRTPLFMASRDSAIRAVLRGQPFDMLRAEHYEQWKDVEITFDPRDMIRG
jgi:colicin import membrane protein